MDMLVCVCARVHVRVCAHVCQAPSELAEQQRAVVSSLQYFKALVDRVGVDKLVLNQSTVCGLLGGASSRVLEAVQILVQLEPHPQNR